MRRALVTAVILCIYSTVSLTADRAEAEAQIAQLKAQYKAALAQQIESTLSATRDQAERADTALLIGTIVEMGMIGDADPIVAYSYYSMASEIGCPEADCAIAALYARGAESPSGVIGRDMAIAVDYYGRAAVGGSVRAMVELGKLYAEGSGEVERDSKKALTYFMDAARRGNLEALQRIEPVMTQAREWEEQRPGRKANFPTTQEDIINTELVEEELSRARQLDRMASKLYIDLNRRVAAAVAKQNDGRR